LIPQVSFKKMSVGFGCPPNSIQPALEAFAVLEDEMLTIDDLAAYLKLKPQTIYRWAQAGKIPGAKFGKEWRFRRSAIERWIESSLPSAQPAAGGLEKDGDRSKAVLAPAVAAVTKGKRKPAAVGSAAKPKKAATRKPTTRIKKSPGPEAN
jgi:excisionase family DNA binding protein